MFDTTVKKKGTTFSPRAPVEVMDSDRTTVTADLPGPDSGAEAILPTLIEGARGRALRVQLAGRFPSCSAEEIEEAIQYACKSFLDEADGISAPGQVYAWIRTAAFRSLGHEADRHHRELAVDPVEDVGIAAVAADDPGPAEELISLEDDADLAMLVEKVSSSLSERGREVFALYGAGHKRPEIADRLGVSEREVKRDLILIMERARAVVARLAGGGCQRGEPLVLRFICGISSPGESAKAREHLSHCGRCELFSERLVAWRDKAGAMLPAPVVEGADPGLLGRIAHASTEKLSGLKQQILHGGAEVKQQAASRAIDPTPLAAARPGTAAAVVASCVLATVGAAAVCVQQNVDPIAPVKGLIASATGEESEPEPEPATPAAESTAPEYVPAETTPPVVEEPPAAEPTTPTEPKPEPTPEPKAESAPPEDSFEPVTPAYQSGGSESSESEPSYEAPAPAPESNPAPAKPGPQFFGG
jgi:RNA polymerase sigma factor (sigma-70 family)